jgi:hypothetical protein
MVCTVRDDGGMNVIQTIDDSHSILSKYTLTYIIRLVLTQHDDNTQLTVSTAPSEEDEREKFYSVPRTV